jgi:hypothetical protein
MASNAPAVSEPAKTYLLTYCYSRNQATYVLFLTVFSAGWLGGRRQAAEGGTRFVSNLGFIN